MKYVFGDYNAHGALKNCHKCLRRVRKTFAMLYRKDSGIWVTLPITMKYILSINRMICIRGLIYSFQTRPIFSDFRSQLAHLLHNRLSFQHFCLLHVTNSDTISRNCQGTLSSKIADDNCSIFQRIHL